jgi:hypothetical protein
MMQSKLIQTFAALMAISLVPSAMALSPEAASILSKKNRRLESPPKALRASEANVDLRYASGRSRLASSPSAQDSADLESVPVTSPNDYINTPIGGSSMSFDYSPNRSKLDRTFGLGFVSAGAYGVFGAEVDFALLDEWTFGFGVGTGMNYSTWGLHSRYLLRKSSAFTPFVELGYANWRIEKVSNRGGDVMPSHLAQRFFSKNSDGRLISGDTAHIVYPGFGISYMLSSGLTLSAQGQYMIHLGDFSGGLTGSAGIYFYF